jgi:hypothetical protein
MVGIIYNRYGMIYHKIRLVVIDCIGAYLIRRADPAGDTHRYPFIHQDSPPNLRYKLL